MAGGSKINPTFIPLVLTPLNLSEKSGIFDGENNKVGQPRTHACTHAHTQTEKERERETDRQRESGLTTSQVAAMLPIWMRLLCNLLKICVQNV